MLFPYSKKPCRKNRALHRLCVNIPKDLWCSIHMWNLRWFYIRMLHHNSLYAMTLQTAVPHLHGHSQAIKHATQLAWTDAPVLNRVWPAPSSHKMLFPLIFAYSQLNTKEERCQKLSTSEGSNYQYNHISVIDANYNSWI